MNITRIPSPNINQGRRGHVPDMICCHITDGSFENAVTRLTRPGSEVSAHFIVARDGRIAQLVEIADTAWANGTAADPKSRVWHGNATHPEVRRRNVNANLYTVSIEHEGVWASTRGALEPAQLEATLWLINHIREEVRRQFGTDIPLTRAHLIGHNETSPLARPNCPGAQFPFDEILRRLNAETPPAPGPAPPAPSAEPSAFAAEAWEWAHQTGITNSNNPHGTPTREQVITMLHRYRLLDDGEATRAALYSIERGDF